MARCPNCGTETAGNFCGNCGAQIPMTPPVAPPPMPPQPPVAPGAMGPVPQYQAPPAPGMQYQAPPAAPGFQYGPMPQPAPAPGTVWQGILVLILGLITTAFVLLGLSATPGDAEAKIGAIAICVLAGLFELVFGIWGLVKNRTAGKIMCGIGLLLWLITLAVSLAA